MTVGWQQWAAPEGWGRHSDASIFPDRSPRDPRPADVRWYPGDAALGRRWLRDALAAARRQGPAGGQGVARRRIRRRQRDDAGAATTGSRASTSCRARDGTMQRFALLLRPARSGRKSPIWLYEVERARDPYALIRYDSLRRVSRPACFDEDWTRYVHEAGHRRGQDQGDEPAHRLEPTSTSSTSPNSTLSTNFLLIAPNIIVLDRLQGRFRRRCASSPRTRSSPTNGFDGQNWQDDFQVTLHVQDEIGVVVPTRQHLPDQHPPRLRQRAARHPSTTTTRRTISLASARPARRPTASRPRHDRPRRARPGRAQRRGAPHPRPKHGLVSSRSRTSTTGLRRRAAQLSAQFDLTATPKHNNGAIFVQTISDYPLVEAIRQNVVKTPVLPDAASRARLTERPSDRVHRAV